MAAGQGRGRAKGSRRPPVLCVEDHPVNVMLMQALFERLPGERLLIAGSIAEALSLMRTQPQSCALLLLDIGLPDGRGTELLMQLRELPSCSSTHAVAVTAEFGFDIHGTGFDEVWEKPLDLPRVLSRLKQLLSPEGWTPLPHHAGAVSGPLAVL
jgi:CheY-like chemotaxis protein